jgi:hypothetical protein
VSSFTSNERALTGGVANAIAENKARYLQTKLNENLELIEQLRQERDVLADNRSDLQRQFARASGVCRSGFQLRQALMDVLFSVLTEAAGVSNRPRRAAPPARHPSAGDRRSQAGAHATIIRIGTRGTGKEAPVKGTFGRHAYCFESGE